MIGELMSVRADIVIQCESCGDQHDEKYPAIAYIDRDRDSPTDILVDAVEQARKDAAVKGWRVRTGPTDLCPPCLGEERRQR